MTFLRSLVRDLVEKRLWPVAAALLVALVAVPVVLGGGSGPAPASRAVGTGGALAPGADAATTARVSVATPASSTTKTRRPGAVRNPFKQQYQPKPVTTASGATSAGTGSAGAAAGGGAQTTAPSAGGGTAPSAGTTPDVKSPSPTVIRPVGPRRVAPSVAQRRVYRVAVRFGEIGAMKTRHDAARLTSLPSTAEPLVMFMGVRSDGKTAVFLVAPGVHTRGDGWCRPRRGACQTLEMRAGDHEVLEMATGTAGIVQYHLVVARVVRRTLKSPKTAARKHARSSKSGRELLRTAIARDVPGASAFRYDRLYGVLRPR